MLKVVIDTNVLLVSISTKSKYHWLFKAIIEQKFFVAFSNEIISEYDEKLTFHWNAEVAKNTIRALIEMPNTIFSTVYFYLNLIENDSDDNKFVDCAFATNADYLVTNDKDFNVLKKIDFPRIKVVTIDEFKDILLIFI